MWRPPILLAPTPVATARRVRKQDVFAVIAVLSFALFAVRSAYSVARDTAPASARSNAIFERLAARLAAGEAQRLRAAPVDSVRAVDEELLATDDRVDAASEDDGELEQQGDAGGGVVLPSGSGEARVALPPPEPVLVPASATPASTPTGSESMAATPPASAMAAPSLPPDVPASAVQPSVSELIGRYRLFPSTSRRWTVEAATTQFGSTHPWSGGSIDCPGGCQVSWTSYGQPNADIRMIHDGSENRWEPNNANQLIALWAAETMDGKLLSRGKGEDTGAGSHGIQGEHYSNYHTELSFRATSFFRENYFFVILPKMRIEGGADNAAEALKKIRCWADVFPAPHDLNDREPLLSAPYGSISFASTHCTSRSGREDYVRELMKHVPVTVVGSTCLAHAPESIKNADRAFHLAFENHACVDYVTEKILWPLLNGQVPIYLGAQNIAEHAPAGSYIDVADFESPAALAAHLRYLEANPAAYARYHAWRRASFETYGIFFRRELLRWIGVAHHVGGMSHGTLHLESSVFRCAMCYSVADWGAAVGWTPGVTPVPPRRIPDWAGLCAPPWVNSTAGGAMPRLPAWPDRAHITAAEYYAPLGGAPAAVAAEARAAADAAAAAAGRGGGGGGDGATTGRSGGGVA